MEYIKRQEDGQKYFMIYVLYSYLFNKKALQIAGLLISIDNILF